MTFWLPEGDGTGGGKLLRPPLLCRAHSFRQPSRGRAHVPALVGASHLCYQSYIRARIMLIWIASFEFTHLYAILLPFASHLSLVGCSLLAKDHDGITAEG